MISDIHSGSNMTLHILDCGYGLGFLVEAPTGLFLIDCGSPGQEHKVLEKMHELDRSDLKLIWITHAHYDHYGSAAALRELTGARIGVHPADADDLAAGKSRLGRARRYGFAYKVIQPVVNAAWQLKPTQPDFTLEDGQTLERFGLNAVIYSTPGHTPGHTSVVLENGIAFAGDLIGGFPRPALQSLLATDWGQLPASLAHLQAVKPARVYSGHSHRPVPGDLFQQIRG